MPDGAGAQGAGQQGAGDAAGSAGNAGQGAGGGKTFTQEQLDAIIADRLGRERDKYRDYDTLKAAAGELEQIKQGQMTETQRMQAQLDQLSKENNELKSKVQMATAQSAAARAGALYPDLVAAKIPADAIGDPKKLEDALKALKTEYPALFGARAGGSADGGAGGGKPAGGGMNAFIRAAAGRG